MKAKLIKKNGLKILMLRSEMNSYGVSKTILNLSRGLNKLGHRVIIGSDNKEIKSQYLNSCRIKHYFIPFNTAKINFVVWLCIIVKIWKIVKAESIDIIHSHHRWCSFLVYLISKMLKIPLITTYHGIHYGKRYYSIWGDRVTVVSKKSKEHLKKYFKVDEEKIVLIHNGIDTSYYNPAEWQEKNSNNKAKNTFIIGCIARLAVEKDHKSLLIGIKKVIRRYPEIRLIIAGSGPLEEDLKGIAIRLGIEKNVTFLGEIENVKQILSCIDVFILTSITEGLPISVLEAMAMEKPVIATPVGEIEALIKNGETGVLVSVGAPNEISKAIEFMVTNKGKIRQYGARGREVVIEKFSLEKMAKETESVYYSVLKLRN